MAKPRPGKKHPEPPPPEPGQRSVAVTRPTGGTFTVALPEGYSRRTDGCCARNDHYFNETTMSWKPVHGSVYFGKPVGKLLVIAADRPAGIPAAQPRDPADVAEARRIVDAIEHMIDHEITPSSYERGEGFLEDVRASARTVLATVEEFNTVTNGQMAALVNWEKGVARWVR